MSAVDDTLAPLVPHYPNDIITSVPLKQTSVLAAQSFHPLIITIIIIIIIIEYPKVIVIFKQPHQQLISLLQ